MLLSIGFVICTLALGLGSERARRTRCYALSWVNPPVRGLVALTLYVDYRRAAVGHAAGAARQLELSSHPAFGRP